MNYMELDTPALIIDREIMMDNLRFMQEYADRRHVALRPHTKTHKMPRLALIQEELGARGVHTVTFFHIHRDYYGQYHIILVISPGRLVGKCLDINFHKTGCAGQL